MPATSRHRYQCHRLITGAWPSLAVGVSWPLQWLRAAPCERGRCETKQFAGLMTPQQDGNNSLAGRSLDNGARVAHFGRLLVLLLLALRGQTAAAGLRKRRECTCCAASPARRRRVMPAVRRRLSVTRKRIALIHSRCINLAAQRPTVTPPGPAQLQLHKLSVSPSQPESQKARELESSRAREPESRSGAADVSAWPSVASSVLAPVGRWQR